MIQKKNQSKEKLRLHPRNKHRERYDFKELILSNPELRKFVSLNKYGNESVDFFNPAAVKALNKALLIHFYKIEYWDIPENYLCPPIPGRADYIHYMADLLKNSNYGEIPKGLHIKCFDIGTGANSIYPIIGNYEYGWSFIGSDIDTIAISNAKKVISSNLNLKNKIEIRLQPNTKDFFYGAIQKGELFDLSICNPPFHSSANEAQKASLQKIKNLTNQKVSNPILNFGGQNNELWCEGGESRFVNAMIRESKKFSDSCFWFSSLVSKQSHLKTINETLKKVNAVDVKIIPMGQGNKTSRIVAWTFLTPTQQQEWKKARWK